MQHRSPGTLAAADTWGISGPDFLLEYAVAAGVLVIVIALVGFWGRSGIGRPRLDPHALTVPEVGLLAHPHGDVVATLTELVDDGWLIARDGRVVAARGSHRPLRTPMHAAIHRVIATQGALPLDDLQNHPDIEREHARLREHLHAHGLMTSQRHDRLATPFVLLIAGWLAVGAARAVSGFVADKPIGNLLTLMLLGAAVCGWVTSLVLASTTTRGRRALATLRRTHRHLQRRRRTYVAPADPFAPLALGVALFGTAAVIDSLPTLARTLSIDDISHTTSRFSGSSDSSSSGGGCGGGGCGG